MSQKYKTIALQKLGDEADYLFNADRSRVICMRNTMKSPVRTILALHFFVYDLKADKIVFEDAPGNAHIKWAGPNKIEVVFVPGIVRGDVDEGVQTRGYTYNLVTQTKTRRGGLAR